MIMTSNNRQSEDAVIVSLIVGLWSYSEIDNIFRVISMMALEYSRV